MSLQTTAKRLHTHKVVFTAQDDVECAIRALLGQSTVAIAAATGLSESQVQYRVSKARINRWEFRNGQSWMAKQMIRQMRPVASSHVANHIAPQFSHLAER